MSDSAENTKLCPNPGNPVFSLKLTPAVQAALKAARQNPMYRTSSSEYGSLPGTYESSPCVFYPKTDGFSMALSRAGMFHNTSLYTPLERSKVYDCPNLQHTL